MADFWHTTTVKFSCHVSLQPMPGVVQREQNPLPSCEQHTHKSLRLCHSYKQTTMLLLLLFFFLLQVFSASAYDVPDFIDCDECVEDGCTWCLFEDQAFADGCYGDYNTTDDGQCSVRIDCSHIDAGSLSLTNYWDCVFETDVGELALALVILMPLGCVCACACCCYFCLRYMTRTKRQRQDVEQPSIETVPATLVEPIQIAEPQPTAPPAPTKTDHYKSSVTTSPPYYNDSNDPYVMPVASWVVEPEMTPVSTTSRPSATNPSYESEFETRPRYGRPSSTS